MMRNACCPAQNAVLALAKRRTQAPSEWRKEESGGIVTYVAGAQVAGAGSMAEQVPGAGGGPYMPAMPGIANLFTGTKVVQDPEDVDNTVISRALMYKFRLLAIKGTHKSSHRSACCCKNMRRTDSRHYVLCRKDGITIGDDIVPLAASNEHKVAGEVFLPLVLFLPGLSALLAVKRHLPNPQKYPSTVPHAPQMPECPCMACHAPAPQKAAIPVVMTSNPMCLQPPAPPRASCRLCRRPRQRWRSLTQRCSRPRQR